MSPSGKVRAFQTVAAMHQKKRLTRKELAAFLRDEHGYPLSDSTLNKLCMPTVNKGPPITGWWGNRPLYDPDEGVAWAEARLTAARRVGVLRGPETLTIEQRLTNDEHHEAKPMFAARLTKSANVKTSDRGAS